MQHSLAMKRDVRRLVSRWVGGLLGFLVLTPSTWAEGPPPPEITQRASAMLERMSQALRSLTYEGTLVYSHDDRLESLHLVHRIDQGRVLERILSLNGPVRMVTREQDRVMCILPDGAPLTIKRQGAAAGLLNTDGIDPEQIVDHYRIELAGVARVAGRETEVVGIVPRDDLRYGYRFYIDSATALPLKSDLIGRDGRLLEQLMFTSITVEEGEPVAAVAPSSSAARVRTAPAAEMTGQWRFDERPAGFQLVRHGVMDHPNGANVEHFMFTDRLSAYSIYVEPDTTDGLEGLTRIGAVNAAGRRIDGYQVTAVGEVPAETVQAAIEGVRMVRGDVP